MEKRLQRMKGKYTPEEFHIKEEALKRQLTRHLEEHDHGDNDNHDHDEALSQSQLSQISHLDKGHHHQNSTVPQNPSKLGSSPDYPDSSTKPPIEADLTFRKDNDNISEKEEPNVY